jgi:hypothetical protein
MTDTPGDGLTKYESLLLMVSSASPQFAFQCGKDELSKTVVHDLMLVNNIVGQFITISEIECRKATATSEPHPAQMHQRRNYRGYCASDGVAEFTRSSRGPFSVFETLVTGTDAEAFKKYIQNEAVADFSPAFRKRLDELAHVKAKEQFNERIEQLDTRVADAKSRLEIPPKLCTIRPLRR